MPHYNLVMLAVRYTYVLALVVWLGGMLVLSALVAPATVQVLQAADPSGGRTLAGALVGALLARFHYVAYGCGAALLVSLALMRIVGPRPQAFAARVLITAAMLGLALYSGLSVIERVVSARLMMANIGGALVLLFWEARER